MCARPFGLAAEGEVAVDDGAAQAAFGVLFWEREHDPAERNKLLRVIVETTPGLREAVPVTPRGPFLPYFQWGQESGGKIRERRDSNPRPPA